MPGPNEILVKYTADITDLQKKTAAVQSSIVKGPTLAVKDLQKQTGEMNARAGKHFTAFAAAVSATTPFLEGTTQRIVAFGTVGTSAVRGLSESVQALGVSIKTALTGALIAGAIALIAYIAHTKAAARAAKEHEEAEKRRKAMLDGLTDTVKRANSSLDSYLGSIKEVAKRRELFGEQPGLEGIQQSLEKAKQSLVAVSIAYDDLTEKIQEGGLEAYEAGRVSQVALKRRIEALKVVIATLEDEEKQALATAIATLKNAEAAEKIKEAWKEAGDKINDIFTQAEQRTKSLTDLAQIQSEQLISDLGGFLQWAVSFKATIGDVFNVIRAGIDTAIQGTANAIANAIVYAQDFGEAMAAVAKQIAATIISMIVEIALQQLIYWALEALGLLTLASNKISSEIAYGAVAAAASVLASVPFPANIALAPIIGAAAAGMLTALAASSMAAGKGAVAGSFAGGLAEGGIVTSPAYALIAEGGQPEVVAPRSDYEKLFDGGGDVIVQLIMPDGQVLAEHVMTNLPRAVRRRGIRGL